MADIPGQALRERGVRVCALCLDEKCDEESDAPRRSKAVSWTAHARFTLLAFTMETLIKSILAHPTLPDKARSAAIANLLGKAAGLSKPDVDVLLDLGVELKSAVRATFTPPTIEYRLCALFLTR